MILMHDFETVLYNAFPILLAIAIAIMIERKL